MPGTIVCGIDETREARIAARVAGGLAQRLGLRLVLVRVVDVPESGGSDPVGRHTSDAERTLATIGDELEQRVPVEARVLFGDRAARLAQAASEEGADLIVLGSRTGGFRGRRLRSSLARELEAATPTPVLLAAGDAERRDGRS